MKIPDNEMQILFDWSTGELERIEKEYPDVRGSFGGNAGGVARKKHFKEYNRRLDILKVQYANAQIVKVQTFSEMLQPNKAQAKPVGV